MFPRLRFGPIYRPRYTNLTTALKRDILSKHLSIAIWQHRLIAPLAQGAQFRSQGGPRNAQQLASLNLIALDVAQHGAENGPVDLQGHPAINFSLTCPQ